MITAETSPAFIRDIFAAGSDDFIRKPIIEPEFVSRVVNRIERLQTHRLSLHSHLPEESQYAQLDPLTQLVNRRYLMQVLQQAWMLQTPLVLILADLDFFALYNERYGDVAGNRCLEQIASAFQRSVDPTQFVVCRYGGDEFAILLLQTCLDQAVRVGQTLQQQLAQLTLSPNLDIPQALITMSMGITGTTPTPEKTIEALLLTADQALHAAKWRGRNTYCLYPF